MLHILEEPSPPQDNLGEKFRKERENGYPDWRLSSSLPWSGISQGSQGRGRRAALRSGGPARPGGAARWAPKGPRQQFLFAPPGGGALCPGRARIQSRRPGAIPGGLLVGGGQARGGEGRVPGQRGVGEGLLAAPGEAWQGVRGLPCGGALRGVGAENLPRGPGGLAAAVQEKQQKGQEEQEGRWKQDAQEGLHVVSGGTCLLGALEFGDEAGLGEGKEDSASLKRLSFFIFYSYPHYPRSKAL